MGKGKKEKKEKFGKVQKLNLAAGADRHVLYQKAVQAPEADIEFFIERYKDLRGKSPRFLREDFCGTAYFSVEWCKSGKKRQALGVDLCADTLAWGKKHNIEPAGADIAEKINLVHANVLDVSEPKVDITCALNFSYNAFRTREELRNYFKVARQGLKEDGIFIMDMFGGTEAYEAVEEEREVEGEDFTYIWEQAKFNPITHDMLCHIHFVFPDGSKLKKAFSYEWRFWMMPEVRELLSEAGFSKIHVYWEEFVEDEDEDSDYLVGTGNYKEVVEVENQESWISYIVAEV
jgi:SAM-dependent methyltransferase